MDDLLSLLDNLPDDVLMEMLYPYQQEQGVLDQEIGVAQQMRQPGPQHSSPLGALLGGMSDALGNAGGAMLQRRGLDAQRALGGKMQRDAAGRIRRFSDDERSQALEDFLRRRGADMGLAGPLAGE